MHIKPDDENERYGDYLQTWKLMRLIKKYSDYIRWPIQMDVTKSDFHETGEKNEDGSPKYETVTTTERGDGQQHGAYLAALEERGVRRGLRERSIRNDSTTRPTPPRHTRERGGPGELQGAAVHPGKAAAASYMSSDFEPGLQLYSSGVMIMERCPDLLAESFYFVRGIVDSPDLSLNISREMLQHDRQLRIIAQNLNKRIKNELVKMLESDREKYEKFYKNYGRQLRYGAVANYGQNVESLSDLLLYRVDVDTTRTLQEYTDAMPAGQEKIYYAVGDSIQRSLRLPQAELVRSRGYELLCMTEEVDEYIVQQLGKHADKPFCNIVTDDLGLETDEERRT